MKNGFLRILFWCGVLLGTFLFASPHHINPSYDFRFVGPGIRFVRRETNGSPSPAFVISNTKSTKVKNTNEDGHIIFPGEVSSDKNVYSERISNWDGTPYVDDDGCSPARGQIRHLGDCYDILSTGYCSRNSWIILDQSGLPKCATRQCNFGQLLYRGKCVKATSKEVCPPNEILYVEFSGKAYCDCEPLLIYSKKIGQCIREHVQASCPNGQYVEVDNNGNAVCKINKCTHDSQVFNPDDGMCYTKNYVGKCKEEEEYFITFSKNGEASCTSVTTRNIFEVPALNACPRGSKRDHMNNCQQVFRVQRRNPFFFRVPTQHTANYFASCPQGYIKYPNNSCQKPNSLFGR